MSNYSTQEIKELIGDIQSAMNTMHSTNSDFSWGKTVFNLLEGSEHQPLVIIQEDANTMVIRYSALRHTSSMLVISSEYETHYDEDDYYYDVYLTLSAVELKKLMSRNKNSEAFIISGWYHSFVFWKPQAGTNGLLLCKKLATKRMLKINNFQIEVTKSARTILGKYPHVYAQYYCTKWIRGAHNVISS